MENRCIYVKCHLHRNISEFNQKIIKKNDTVCQNSLLLIQRATDQWAILIWWILKAFSIQVICSVQFSNSKFWRSDERKQIILVWAVRETFFKNKPSLQKSLRNVGLCKINLSLLCVERLHLIQTRIFNSEVNFFKLAICIKTVSKTGSAWTEGRIKRKHRSRRLHFCQEWT